MKFTKASPLNNTLVYANSLKCITHEIKNDY